MALLTGCMAMSHAPQLMLNPDQWGLLRTRAGEHLAEKPELRDETLEIKWDKWRRCMAAVDQLRKKSDELRPDVLVVVGDDQHENLLDDAMPPFTIFIGNEVEASTSLQYLKEPKSANRIRYCVDVELGNALLTGLMNAGFDPAYARQTRYEGGLGHAFARPLRFLMPDRPCRIVPIMVNTYYPPAPTAKRCIEFGRALASIIRAYPSEDRVVILGSGGLSHTKIDESLDEQFLSAVKTHDIESMSALPCSALVEGTSEIRNWIVTAAAAGCEGEVIEYVPLYRTTTGVGCAMGFAYWDLT
jgi:3-O-methylgallate 3,4-dioxygenase